MSVEPNQAMIQLTGLREMLVSYLCTWQCVLNTNSLGNVLQVLDQQQLEQIFYFDEKGKRRNLFQCSDSSKFTLQTQQLLSITGIQLPE